MCRSKASVLLTFVFTLTVYYIHFVDLLNIDLALQITLSLNICRKETGQERNSLL